jgi:hypothetical protein
MCRKFKEKEKLDTKEFLWNQQEMKISEGYNLINNRAKLWYQMMRTSWSCGHATHMQRCLESPRKSLAWSNSQIENYDYCYKPRLLRILHQNLNLTLLGSYHKVEPYQIPYSS